MPNFHAEQLKKVGAKIFESAGVQSQEARIVANSLVNSNLAGHDSHGIIRIPQYIALIKKGDIVPEAEITIVKDNPSTAVLDGNWGFGQVMAREAMKKAINKAKNNSLAAISMSRSNHVGRLGEYPAMAAEENMIGMIAVNNHGAAQCMSAWGGISRRLSPNPVSIGLPSGENSDVLLDITTAVVAEGKVRVKRNRGEELPEGCIIDSEGKPSTNPNDFYGPPPGAILPFGGIVGHKGYGLGFILDILAGALSGAGCSRADAPRFGNAVFINVINIESFISINEFKAHVDGLIDYVKSSPKRPDVSEILFPGEIEEKERIKRLESGIYIEDETWGQIIDIAKESGLDTKAEEFDPI
ncbi:Ldh family oxidoreductase [Candidatus Poribacteria bacterium]|nr:Ldh family oxidoreductase [Candidatus Poribacteria bacterium]